MTSIGTLPILIIYSLIIVAMALLGGWIPQVVKLTHNWMQILISFVGGLILGISIFHMLPHALAEVGPEGADWVAIFMMAGLLVMFLLLRAFHFHQHEPPGLIGENSLPLPPPTSHSHSHIHSDPATTPASRDSSASASLPVLGIPTSATSTNTSSCDHGHVHTHSHHNHSHHGHHHGHDHHHGTRQLSWFGVMFGLSLHALLDGLAVAASVEADAHHGSVGWGLYGLGTFLAVALHTPLDAISITALIGNSNWSARRRLLLVLAFSAMCPIGAFLFWLGYRATGGNTSWLVGCSLAFSSGLFLCIALSDLLPEMEFHSHNRIQLSAALIAGIGLAYLIGLIEPEHAHSHEAKERNRQSAVSPVSDEHDHDHSHEHHE